MKNTIKTIIITIITVILIISPLGIKLENDYNQTKTYQIKRHQILMESRKLAKQKEANELPAVYQEKALKSLKSFTDSHKLTSDDKLTLENLVYENAEQYQELWFDIH